MRMRSLVAALAAAVLFVASGSALGKAALLSNLEAQLGLRFEKRPPANASVGSTFDAVVVEPGKLAQHGFAGIQKNQRVTLRIAGPNNEFDVIHGPSNLTKSFSLNAQGVVSPRLAAPPAVQQAPGVQKK